MKGLNENLGREVLELHTLERKAPAPPRPGKPPPPDNKPKPKFNQIRVDAKGQAFLNEQPVTMDVLRADLKQLKSDNPELGVVVNGDDDVDYQSMIAVLDILRQLDITKVGLATQ